MDDFFAWAASARDLTPGRNLATNALGCALNQEADVLCDGNIPLDNTRAEHALRKIIVVPSSARAAGRAVSLILRSDPRLTHGTASERIRDISLIESASTLYSM
jgi:hypothetical protein